MRVSHGQEGNRHTLWHNNPLERIIKGSIKEEGYRLNTWAK